MSGGTPRAQPAGRRRSARASGALRSRQFRGPIAPVRRSGRLRRQPAVRSPLADSFITSSARIRRLMTTVRIKDLSQHVGEKVTVNGWLYNKRTSGKLQFPIIRDGSGYLQCVVSKKEVSDETWSDSDRSSQEASISVTGNVVAESRAPGGVEMHVAELKLLGVSENYPISPKEHGTDFLMNHRHLWLRSTKQHAVLRVRNEIEKAIRDFFY